MQPQESRWKLQPQHRITEGQFESILQEAARSPRDWTLMFVTGNTSLRISEVMHLRVKGFDRNSGLQCIPRKKKVLEPDVLAVALELFDYVEQYVKEAGLKPDDWLFPGECGECWRKVSVREKGPDGRLVTTGERREKVCEGGHLTVRRAQAVWDRILVKLGIKVEGRGIHTLRHYDLTRFYAATKDLRATQKRAHHSSPITTTIYADVVEMQEKADEAGITVSSAPWKAKKPSGTPPPKGEKGRPKGSPSTGGPIRD